MESEQQNSHDPLIPSRAEAAQHLAQLDAAETELFTSADYPSWFAPYTGLCYGVLAAALDSSLAEWQMVAVAVAASTAHGAAVIPLVLRQGVTPRVRDAPHAMKRQIAWFGAICIVAFAAVFGVAAVATWWLTGVAAFVVACSVVQVQVHRARLISTRLSAAIPIPDLM